MNAAIIDRAVLEEFVAHADKVDEMDDEYDESEESVAPPNNSAPNRPNNKPSPIDDNFD